MKPYSQLEVDLIMQISALHTAL